MQDVYFNDRVALGETLARGLEDLRGKDAVILCLKESSLLTCLTMAQKLRAWVYPLLYVPLSNPGAFGRPIGAFDEEGVFCPNPDVTNGNAKSLSAQAQAIIESQKAAAAEAIKTKRASYEMEFDKRLMEGRDVIIAGDVITSPLPVAVAMQLLGSIRPKSLRVAVGNATPPAASLLRICADKPVILDVLSGVVHDDGHYFQHTDGYTAEQTRTLTHNITAYWQ